MGGNVEDTLAPVGGGRFRVGDRPNDVLFPAPKIGVPREMHILLDHGPRVFSRVTVPLYSASELKAYVGEYRSDELDATFAITTVSEDHLAVLRRRSNPIELAALTPDTFFGNFSDGAGTLTFVRTPSGAVAGFTINGRTPRRLSFTRVNVARSTGK